MFLQILIESKIELQMETLKMLFQLLLRANLLEMFYHMLVLLASEPFYLAIISGMDSVFILVCGSMDNNAACHFLCVDI